MLSSGVGLLPPAAVPPPPTHGQHSRTVAVRLLLHTTAKTNLDKGMQILVSYIDNIQSDDALKEFYFDFVKVFEAHVLPVPTGHVQFIAFYLMGRYKPGPALTTHFLEFLWKKFQSPNTPSVIR